MEEESDGNDSEGMADELHTSLVQDRVEKIKAASAGPTYAQFLQACAKKHAGSGSGGTPLGKSNARPGSGVDRFEVSSKRRRSSGFDDAVESDEEDATVTTPRTKQRPKPKPSGGGGTQRARPKRPLDETLKTQQDLFAVANDTTAAFFFGAYADTSLKNIRRYKGQAYANMCAKPDNQVVERIYKEFHVIESAILLVKTWQNKTGVAAGLLKFEQQWHALTIFRNSEPVVTIRCNFFVGLLFASTGLHIGAIAQ